MDTLGVFHLVTGEIVYIALTRNEMDEVIRWIDKKAVQLVFRQPKRVVTFLTDKVVFVEWVQS